MTPERYKLVKEIFQAVTALPDEQQRQAVAVRTADDPELRREVESLLDHHHRETKLMSDQPQNPLLARGVTTIDTPPSGAGYLSGEGAQQPRFTAGTLVANRYRIVGLLGRGGMGEVYRADDLMLSHPVALKFLPPVFSADPKWLARFHNEVRLARQVAHPNVCRVFDIGEFAGEQFISMEYIDGENLASLLRRIGRLSPDKAVQIARQLCSGLAAAHDRGVLHRDLKPANIMIDGRGHVRITDFGLAAPADSSLGRELRAGTPAYMSPEQLAGKEVTTRNDIYALGLVLYEMFTGKPAFDAESYTEYVRLHETQLPRPPHELVTELEPGVERVILRCLEKQPSRRPPSAIAVAAALPGGDPLAAALEAGETPSPEMVAASGSHERMALPRALTLLGLVIVGLIVTVVLSSYSTFLDKIALKKPPAVLIDRAQGILQGVGYQRAPRDQLWGFATDDAFYRYVSAHAGTQNPWNELAATPPGPVYFWYEQSPQYFTASDRPTALPQENEPGAAPGTVHVQLSPGGVLRELTATPPTQLPATGAADTQPAALAAAWAKLFTAAGLQMDDFHAVAPSGTPPVFAETRAAWESGRAATDAGGPVRVEAAAAGGRPVYFQTLYAWQGAPAAAEGSNLSLSNLYANRVVRDLTIVALLAAGLVLTWRNVASGRADRSGAMKLVALFVFIGAAVWALDAHHVPDAVAEYHSFVRGMGYALYMAALVWVSYLAIEPFVRRTWPQTIISWSRLLGGRILDPVVGRDVLIGATAGVACAILLEVDAIVPSLIGLPTPLPVLGGRIGNLTQSPLASILNIVLGSIFAGLLLLLLLVVGRTVLRSRIAAGILFVAVLTAASTRWLPYAYVSWAIEAIIGLTFLLLLTRFGLVAMISCLGYSIVLREFPITADVGIWYAANATYALVFAAAAAAAATYAAVTKRTRLGLSESSVVR